MLRLWGVASRPHPCGSKVLRFAEWQTSCDNRSFFGGEQIVWTKAIPVPADNTVTGECLLLVPWSLTLAPGMTEDLPSEERSGKCGNVPNLRHVRIGARALLRQL